MNIGLRIRELRTQKNMTGAALADAIGVSQAQISRYETGENEVPLSTLRLICAALDVTLAEFFAPEGGGDQVPPELRRLLEKARELTPEELAAVQQLLDTMSKGKRTCVYEAPPDSELATQAAHRTDDPTRELPEEARRSLAEFKQHIRKKYGKKKPATDG
ncbi:MAG: helix-turn-helix domain-containing protein [Bacillota bacterium]